MPEIAEIACSMRKDYAVFNSWKTVGDHWGVTKPMAYRIALKGYEPRSPKIRVQLGLPNSSSVVVMYGVVPVGTQVISAQQCILCGRWFISNHPRRKKCFVCSAYRKAGKHETQS